MHVAHALVLALFVGAAGCATTQTPPTPTADGEDARRTRKKKQRRAARPVEAPVIAERGAAAEDEAEAPTADDVAVQTGMASYYADMLSGRPTASGEKYRPDKKTCAHRTLPFGTQLEVRAVESGRTARCRVNDRGPYAKQRLLDVSKRVARELGMVEAGVVRVEIRVVDD